MAFNFCNALLNYVPAGDWGTVPYRVIAYRAFATRALQKLNVPGGRALAAPAGAALWLRDAIFSKALPKTRGSVVIEATDRFDSRFDAFWDELIRQKPYADGEKGQRRRFPGTLPYRCATGDCGYLLRLKTTSYALIAS